MQCEEILFLVQWKGLFPVLNVHGARTMDKLREQCESLVVMV